MMSRVYLETTILSYLCAQPSRDIVVAGHQQLTRAWWESCSEQFDVVASELVVQEASRGDPEAVRSRLAVLGSLNLIEVSEAALDLARRLLAAGAMPPRAV